MDYSYLLKVEFTAPVSKAWSAAICARVKARHSGCSMSIRGSCFTFSVFLSALVFSPNSDNTHMYDKKSQHRRQCRCNDGDGQGIVQKVMRKDNGERYDGLRHRHQVDGAPTAVAAAC